MTWGAEINFGGAREVYLCEFERGTGALFIVVWIKRTANSKILVIVLATFDDFFSEDQKIKKKSSIQKFPQILVFVPKFLRFFTNF